MKCRKRACIVGAIGLCVVFVTGIYIGYFVAGQQQYARNALTRSRFSQLALALRNYHADYGAFPPLGGTAAMEHPKQSWRVLLLPYLNLNDVYERYDFDEPWNATANAELATSMSRTPQYFRSGTRSDHDGFETDFVAIAADDVAWPGGDPLLALQVTADGESLLIVERRDSGLHWMAPEN
jgi:hypothetical protein